MSEISDEDAFKQGFYGENAEKLSAMSADELATWQAGWKQHTANFILAEKEWQKRMIAHEFDLNRQLAEYAAKWQRFSAYIGVIGAILGAIAGAYIQGTAQNQTGAGGATASAFRVPQK